MKKNEKNLRFQKISKFIHINLFIIVLLCHLPFFLLKDVYSTEKRLKETLFCRTFINSFLIQKVLMSYSVSLYAFLFNLILKNV